MNNKPKNIMGAHAWSLMEEGIDRMPDGAFSIGIGIGAEKLTGLSRELIAACVGGVVHSLVDGGANMAEIEGHTIYIRRRGKAVDVGSRSDFVELGWSGVCDALDMRRMGQSR